MEALRVDELERRVAAMELRCSRSRCAAATILLAAGVALGLVGAQVPRASAPPLEPLVSRLELRDRVGRLRAVFDLAADQTPQIAFLDAAGKERVLLGLAADGAPSLRLCDENGKDRVLLGALRGGIGDLRFQDAAGKLLARLGARSDGTVDLTLRQRDQRDSLVLGTRPLRGGGLAGLSMFGPDGKIRIGVGYGPGESAGVTVYGSGDRYRIGLGVSQDGKGGLTIVDRDGAPLFRTPDEDPKPKQER
jgi:hypothetical protein